VIKRIKTGITGLDSIIQGGLVEGSVSLLSGSTGTGKTILGCQYIHHGLERGDPGIYITMEESPDDIRRDALQFGWDFEKYEKKGMCSIVYHDPAHVNNVGTLLINEIEKTHAKRLVIDSTTVMNLNIDNSSIIRKKIFSIVNTIKKVGSATGILIADIPEDSKQLSSFGVAEFVADGVIILNYLGIEGATARSLMVRKMRRTNHGNDIYPMHITSKGIVIKKGDM